VRDTAGSRRARNWPEARAGGRRRGRGRICAAEEEGRRLPRIDRRCSGWCGSWAWVFGAVWIRQATDGDYEHPYLPFSQDGPAPRYVLTR
jgi:hypothetical protein